MEADSDDEDEKGAFDTGDLEGEFSRAGVNHRDQDAGCVHDRPWEEDRMSSVFFSSSPCWFRDHHEKIKEDLS